MFTIRKVENPEMGATMRWTVDLRPTLRWLVRSRLNRQLDVAQCASAFHHVIADTVLSLCLRIRGEDASIRVGLTGGGFQNQILTRRVREGLSSHGIGVSTHSLVPPNDGGLALGQAVIARRLLE